MSFKSWLQHIGHDIKVGLDFVLPVAEGAGEVAVHLFAPALGPLFNQTVAVVSTVEQSAVALESSGTKMTGAQKLASAVQLIAPLVKQVLHDAGKDNSDAAVESYINAVVAILNAAPAPANTTGV